MACLPPTLYNLWSPGDHKIAQLEMLMIQYALVERAQRFRGRRGIWYIDNVASLMALVRGRSDSPDLDLMVRQIHTMLFALGAWFYWEWVPTKSNWADAISRLGRRIHGTGHVAFQRRMPFSRLSCGSYHCPLWCSLCSFCKVLWDSALGDSWTGCPHRVSDHDANSICLSGGEA